MFAAVLHMEVENIGIKDNFFELGGHSLLATQVISRVRQVFAVDISLRSLFEEPTVESVSKIISNTHSPLVKQLQAAPIDELENREEVEF